jgi:2-polyprenyl-3-methyl-5-hydroxy-6-metoxy-1,4-benzoquinol methylase
MTSSPAPFAYRVARAFRKLFRIDRERRWNAQYAEGGWDRLRKLEELAHHAVLAAYFTRLKPAGSVLDVGCGEGIFHEQLHGAYRHYLGIDFAEPVRQAEPKADERTAFQAADMHDFSTDARFDAIVFNESLYYHHDPMTGLRHYETMLAPEGVLLVSMHETPRNIKLWALITARYRVVDSVRITNTQNVAWTVAALLPPLN